MNRILTTWLTISFLLTAFGCATTQELSINQQDKINSIYFYEESETPPNAIHHGTAQSLAATIGGVAGLVLDKATSKDELIDLYIEQHNIDIGQIAREAVTKSVLTHPKLASKNVVNSPKEADSHLNVDVYLVGLGEIDGFSNVYRPILGIRVKISDSSGSKIWQSLESVTANTESIEGLVFEEYFSDPTIFIDRFSAAATAIAEKISDNI